MDLKYSTIVLRNHVKHIYDHDKDKILCGQNRWYNTPFTLQKAKYNKQDIIEKHHKHGEDRGGANPYKFICLSCLKKLNPKTKVSVDKIYKKEHKKLEKRHKEFEKLIKERCGRD